MVFAILILDKKVSGGGGANAPLKHATAAVTSQFITYRHCISGIALELCTPKIFIEYDSVLPSTKKILIIQL